MFIFDTLMNRMRRGCQTMAYPKGPAPALPDRHGGALRLDATLCPDGCTQCEGVCPVEAITLEPGQGTRLDLGRCLFCGDCVRTCPHGAITTTNDHRLAVRRREDLILGRSGEEELRLAAALDKKMKSLLGRSLRLRQVSAGGCNACEADINVLGTIGWDLGRFGIQYAASPRHADGVLITGPVTKGMELALQKTWEAVPEPRIAIALGACAISGGPFIGHPQHNGGADPIIPIDLYIPGCPPHPLTILDGFLRLLDRLPKHNL
ncbi:MAG: 4Fe-4S dicluster domain-containing protein [Desulfomicrobium sp.]|jgi:Ni,Fe-hydrogenase III small subunit/NAD-dependent dihydropyrimidine dehydrogenase PreA subunit|nr:4Fe-4S dicluster domain-containing protein [Desulfomicrobium sp.]MDP3430320.1 4Fe-4S dicluster domain-containing protein [Desulfomicrobium sp.]